MCRSAWLACRLRRHSCSHVFLRDMLQQLVLAEQTDVLSWSIPTPHSWRGVVVSPPSNITPPLTCDRSRQTAEVGLSTNASSFLAQTTQGKAPGVGGTDVEQIAVSKERVLCTTFTVQRQRHSRTVSQSRIRTAPHNNSDHCNGLKNIHIEKH